MSHHPRLLHLLRRCTLPLGLVLSIGAAGATTRQTSSSASKERPLSRAYISNPDAFARKWKKFSAVGLDKLLVIADFDHTLTPCFKSNGERGASSHGLLLSSNVLSPGVAPREKELRERFYPIEISPKLTMEQKTPFMIEWWTKAHEILIEEKLTKQQIQQAVTQGNLTFRPGFHELFQLLTEANVPTLVFSAGLYDVIHAAIEKEYSVRGTTTPSNVHVVSNMMRFNALTGELMGFEGKLIHCFNKNASIVTDTPFWQQCQAEERKNILLLGDSLGDVSMAHGLDFAEDEILRVGFLNTNVDESLEAYLQVYDMVLTHDASLSMVQTLLQSLKC